MTQLWWNDTPTARRLVQPCTCEEGDLAADPSLSAALLPPFDLDERQIAQQSDHSLFVDFGFDDACFLGVWAERMLSVGRGSGARAERVEAVGAVLCEDYKGFGVSPSERDDASWRIPL